MKKFKMVFAICAMMLVLCGCSIKTEYVMSIKNDKSMDFSIVLAMDEELIDGMLSMENQTEEEVEYTDEQRWALVDSSMEEEITKYGFSKERYDKGEYYGYKYTKKISNIDDISGETANFVLEEFENISESIVFVKDGNKYKANFIMSNEEQSDETEGYDVDIDMLFVITLPNKPISNNATKVSEDGKTLTWDLLEEDSKNISFEFEFKKAASTSTETEEDSGIAPYILYIGIGIGAATLISVIAVVIVLKNKKKNNVTPITQEPVQPVVPSMPSVPENMNIPEDNNTNNQ